MLGKHFITPFELTEYYHRIINRSIKVHFIYLTCLSLNININKCRQKTTYNHHKRSLVLLSFLNEMGHLANSAMTILDQELR